MKTISNPIIPAHWTSIHSKYVMMTTSNGPVQSELQNILMESKRFTSFDNKLTILPGAVSPKADCDKRRA